MSHVWIEAYYVTGMAFVELTVAGEMLLTAAGCAKAIFLMSMPAVGKIAHLGIEQTDTWQRFALAIFELVVIRHTILRELKLVEGRTSFWPPW